MKKQTDILLPHVVSDIQVLRGGRWGPGMTDEALTRIATRLTPDVLAQRVQGRLRVLSSGFGTSGTITVDASGGVFAPQGCEATSVRGMIMGELAARRERGGL